MELTLKTRYRMVVAGIALGSGWFAILPHRPVNIPTFLCFIAMLLFVVAPLVLCGMLATTSGVSRFNKVGPNILGCLGIVAVALVQKIF